MKIQFTEDEERALLDAGCMEKYDRQQVGAAIADRVVGNLIDQLKKEHSDFLEGFMLGLEYALESRETEI